MKRLVLSLVVSLAVGIYFAPCAFSDTMSFSGTVVQQGTGFGNVLNLLTLQHNGTETGAVVPNSVHIGDAQPNSRTYNVSQLTAAGVTAANFGIIFNPNESGPGDSVTVQSFNLDFYHANNLVTPFATAFLTGVPVDILPISTGQGSQGWLLTYFNTTGDLTTFFSDPTNIIGAHGSITNTSDGPDDFNIVQSTPSSPSVPEPTSMLLLGLGLIGVSRARRMLKK